MQQRAARHRWSSSAVVLATAFALAAATQQAAVAVPETKPHVDTFASSFESDDPAVDWRNTVDTASDGSKRASGVDGGYSTGIPGNLNDHVTDIRANGEYADSGEVKENLVDAEPGTKWLVFQPTGWVEFDLDGPAKVVNYALTSANDAAERDPRDWTLQGSTDGKDWKTLDTRSGESFPERFQTKSYDLAEPAEYQHFRIDITRNNGASGITQLADLQLSTGSSGDPVPQDMLTLVDRGPSGSPTAKSGAGFTGTRALRYAGFKTPAKAGRTRTTRSSTSTCPSAGTPRCRTGSTPRWRTATATTTPPTSPSTWSSPTAPTSAAWAPPTSTASPSPRRGRARPRSST